MRWWKLINEAEELRARSGWGLAAVWSHIHRGEYAEARARLDELDGYVPILEFNEPHSFEDDGAGRCHATLLSRSGTGGYLCAEPEDARIHKGIPR